ncbi:MAG: tetratricopeptide repeat protein [Candidatus Korobacteraceae bacterium]
MAVPAPSGGELIGHYRLVEQIGAGGMGVVFRAHDEQLQRDVAVKILPHGLFSDEASRRQFRKEALAVGKLNHPNIAMAFDFGQQDGVDYLVTEYIPGLNLDEKIGRQPLPQKMVLELGIQLASGLEAAHREKIIHRDLKPGNLRLNDDGQLKILDFGLAQMIEPIDELAETANVESNLVASGTLPYMSPEVLRAETADERSDIWAAGAVLYEMATGKRAFPDRQPSLLIDSILHYDPVRPTLINPQITAPLEAVILKALDRDPDRRYQSARELRVDLARLLAGGEIATDTVRRSGVVEIAAQARGRKILLGLVAVLLAGIAAGYFVKRWWPVTSTQQRILAVLPIETVGQDAATSALGLGLTETLTAKLVQASDSDSIQVVSPRDLRDQNVKTAEDARREFGTDFVLESSMQRSGQTIRINCYLVDSKTHRQIAAKTIEVNGTDAFNLQDQVVNAALDMLPARIRATQRKALAVRQDTQPTAYEAYIRGRGYLQEYEKPENIDNAITEFNQAIKIDPKYAPAYAGLGEAYWIGFQQLDRGKEWLNSASSNCQRSMALDKQLPQAYICLGNVALGAGKYEEAIRQYQTALGLDPNGDYALGQLAEAYEKSGNVDAAEAAYKRAITIRPGYWAVYNWLGAFYVQQARYGQASEMFRKVTELAPDNYRGYSNLGGVYVYEGRYSDAIGVLKRSIQLRPNADAYSNLGTAYFAMRHFGDAAESFQQGITLDNRNWMNWGNLADALYWAPGRRQEAMPIYEKAIALARAQIDLNSRDATTVVMMAEYYAMLGQKQQALDSLQNALGLEPKDSQIMFRAALIYNHFGDTDASLLWLKRAIDAGFSRSTVRDFPDFDSLQSNPHFRALIPSD